MKTLKHVNKYFRLKLFYGYRYFLVKFFFFSLKLKILFITIIFLNLLIDRKKNKKFHGLALGRSIFNEDIKVLNKTSDIVSYDNLSGSFFNYLITEYVSKDILKKSIIQYQLDIKNRKMIYELISKVIYWLLKLNKYDFIINCNYDYLRRQEIAQYCVDNSIPYLVFYKEGINSKVEGRLKNPYSIWLKIKTKNITFEQLSDIMAFRIIVNSSRYCYQALGAIHKNYSMVPGRFKDFISVPKENGYRSLLSFVKLEVANSITDYKPLIIFKKNIQQY